MLSFLLTNPLLKYITLSVAVAALCMMSYFRGAHSTQIKWDADKAAIQAQYNAKLQTNYIMGQAVIESYHRLSIAQAQKSTYTAAHVATHKKDVNASNHISDSYFATLQSAATGTDITAVNFTNYASNHQANIVLEYTVALIDDNVQCVNQLTSLQNIIKGVAK